MTDQCVEGLSKLNAGDRARRIKSVSVQTNEALLQSDRNVAAILGRDRRSVSNRRRKLRRRCGRFETGRFYSGHRDQTVLGLTVRARPGYIISLNGEWNQIDLVEGSFASNVFRGVADTQFSPFMAIVNIIQFDTMSRVFGWQSRYRWILTPGNDLYVVYTHNWLEDPVRDRFATLDRRAASKVLYTHRF